jgi:peptide/nickel transport system substrate-binding protein
VVAAASLALLLMGCRRAPPVELPAELGAKPAATPSERPTPEPPPPAELTICLAQEPTTLYLYGDTNRATDVILEAIYDGPFDLLGFQPEPVIMEKTPSLADGDMQIEAVAIAIGDVYVNPRTLEPESLRRGSPVLPSGCLSQDCLVDFNGGEIEVDRMRVRYELLPGLLWSDGEPLTAADSVFSYDIDGDPQTPTPKYLYARTFSYKTLDELTVEWVGLPGFLDVDVASSFWTPLPEHVLGEVEASELQTHTQAIESPLGWGAYRLEAWKRGERLHLSRNPNYAGATGPPAFDQLIFRFEESPEAALEGLRSGRCDILDEALLPLNHVDVIRSAPSQSGIEVVGVPGSVVERLDFNHRPRPEGEQASLFSDVSTRKGLAACLDRVDLAAGLYGPEADVSDSFLPPSHPQYVGIEGGASGGAAQGMDLLEEAGWTLAEGEEVRRAQGVPGVSNSTPLAFELTYVVGEMTEQVASRMASKLAECGVQVELRSLPAEDFYGPYPEGIVFGREFDVVLWGWPAFSTPACEMFASWEVATDATPLGINASGHQDSVYDDACRSLIWSAPGTGARTEAVGTVQTLVQGSLPSVPLFVRPRYVAYANWVCGLELDGSARTVLRNLESIRPCP